MRSAVFVLMIAMSSPAMAQEPPPEVVAPPPAAQAPATGPKAAPKPARPRVRRAARGGLSAHLGLTIPYVEHSDKNCWGGESGAMLRAAPLYVRWTRTHMTYEARDRSDTCDGLFAGDSDVTESAWTGGLMLGRSGFFAGMGGTDVNVERSYVNTVDYGRDHGRRYEIGFSSLARFPSVVGFEVVVFRGQNDVRDYSGVSLSASLGF